MMGKSLLNITFAVLPIAADGQPLQLIRVRSNSAAEPDMGT